MPQLRGSEWLIIILLVVLLFGAKRMPDAARSMGRSLRIFKAETKGLIDDDAKPEAPPVAGPAVTGTAVTGPSVTGASGGQAQAQPVEAPPAGTPVTPPTNQA